MSTKTDAAIVEDRRKLRDRLFADLTKEVRAIRSLAWLAVHAKESGRVEFSTEEYQDQLEGAMAHIATCAKRADQMILGERWNDSLSDLICSSDKADAYGVVSA